MFRHKKYNLPPDSISPKNKVEKMLNDQENYDTFEYEQSDGEMYEPLSDTIVAPKLNAPPLPPARNKLKQDTQKKPLGLPKHSKQDFRSGSLPRINPIIPQVPDCDENYEEFPCQMLDDPQEENYECFDNDLVENDPPVKIKPPLPGRRFLKEKLKAETKPQPIVPKFSASGESPSQGINFKGLVHHFNTIAQGETACTPSLGELLHARNNLRTTGNEDRVSIHTESEPTFKRPDLTKSKEKPQPASKPSFMSEINNKVKNFTLPGKEPSSMNQKKSIGSDYTNTAPKRNSFGNSSIPQPSNTEQDDTDDEDPREVYADACDARLFLQNKPWYFGKLGRKAEESLLNEIKQNGAFLLRDSSQASVTHPFTLTVYSNDHFYRLKIRHLESGKFVVGEKKDSEIEFNTIQDLITYYETEPLLLLAAANNSNSCTTLKYIPEKAKTPSV
ncbi:B-cell linker protein isoform X2 [Octopus sinensis]|uniref:B-cell linker protein isoform X2 n=1 Tax=Octopus sinensis TaxID=2607531 RepID=A0A7E6FCF7_9MOLL|nr:B-cell linker protein isoform X2 [Octopus sinensis]